MDKLHIPTAGVSITKLETDIGVKAAQRKAACLRRDPILTNTAASVKLRTDIRNTKIR